MPHRQVPAFALARASVVWLAIAMVGPAAAEPSTPEQSATTVTLANAAEMAQFLDKLMLAESGGRDHARNPRSTAVGPFQFIESTFLEVCRRHFATETAALLPAQILALRTDRAFARRAAEAFTHDNAAILAASDIAATKVNLRLAFLLGATGAVRALTAEATTPIITVVGAHVVQANPFMAGMTARDLVHWSHRNLAVQMPDAILTVADPTAGTANVLNIDGSRRGTRSILGNGSALPRAIVTCNSKRASCRKHLELAQRRLDAELTKTVAVAQPRHRIRAQ